MSKILDFDNILNYYCFKSLIKLLYQTMKNENKDKRESQR